MDGRAETPAGDASRLALVLAGGIGLGAFEAGAYAALDAAGLAAGLDWVAGSSIGAVTASLIAGNRPQDRVARLRAFWRRVASDPMPLATWFGAPSHGPWRQAANQASAMQTLLLGRSGLFRPRLEPGPRAGAPDVPALFDLAPLEPHLEELVDFTRLNTGGVRVSLATTDVVSGERVVFDTARGCAITPRHVLASCALLPLFAPIEIDGRLLADGGLASNAPLDLVLGEPGEPGGDGRRCIVVDLFAPAGQRPHGLADAASRAGDLAFANQSRRLMEAQAREDRLRRAIFELGGLLPEETRARETVAAHLLEGRERPADIITIGYRAGLDEAGLVKPFDFSSATIEDRWRGGEAALAAALA